MKIQNLVTFNWENAIYGMRSSFKSYDKIDSNFKEGIIGENDLELMKKLIKGGSSHRRFLRSITVSYEMDSPLYFLKEFDKYSVGVNTLSESTMHKITSKPLSKEDFECEEVYSQHGRLLLTQTINTLNMLINTYKINNDKKVWKEIIQLLPSSFIQKRFITCNYEVLYNIYKQRQGHRLIEWSMWRNYIEKNTPYFNELFGEI